MPNGQLRGAPAFQAGVRDISRSLGDLARQRLAAQAFEQQQAQEQQQAIELLRAKARIKQEFAAPPSATEQLIQQAKAAEAAQLLGDEALFNQIRGGGQPTAQPTAQPVAQPTRQPVQQFGRIGIQPTQPEIQAQQSLATPQDFVATKGKLGPFGRVEPTDFISPSAKRIEEGIKADVKRSEKTKDVNLNFNKTVSLFRNLISQVKGKGEEQEGLGLAPGLYGAVNTIFKNPKFSRTASFPGQRRETALTLNNVLTGQNRVIKSVLEMIEQTLPTEFDPDEFIANKSAQSLRNAFGLVKAFEKAGLTPERIQGMSQEELNAIDAPGLIAGTVLSPQEEEEIELLIQDVLAAPPSQPRTLGKVGRFGTQQIQAASPELQDIESELEAINRELGGL